MVWSETGRSSSISHHLLSSIPPSLSLSLSRPCCLPLLSNCYHLGYPCPTANSEECVCVLCYGPCDVFVSPPCVCGRLHCSPTHSNVGNSHKYFLGVITDTEHFIIRLPQYQLAFVCERQGVWALVCQRWFVCRGVRECVSACARALVTRHCTTHWAWRHLTLNNRCGCSEYLMSGGVDTRTLLHTYTNSRGNGNIISTPVWLLDRSSRGSGLIEWCSQQKIAPDVYYF